MPRTVLVQRVTGHGLTSAQAARLLAQHGPNRLPEPPADSLARRLLRQLRSPLVYVLLAGLVFEVAYWAYEGAREVPIEALAIGAALLANAALGAWQEHRSEAALASLRRLAAPRARVVRDGALQEVPAHEIVPGDLVRLEAGDRLPADGIFRHVSGALVDESLLTGESVPLDKRAGEEGSSGTVLVRGRADLEATRTGPASAMGRLATMLATIEASRTPLERRLQRLGNQVAAGVVAIGAILIGVGFYAEGPAALADVVFFAVALAVAAVPEELPAVLALTLALGVERMAKRNALVRRLAAVEALGSVTVIATDKTGTLTENRLHVRRLLAVDEDAALRAMVLANEADPTTGEGDPLEVAFLDHGRARGIDVVGHRAARERVSDRPFDSAWKFMRVSVREEGKVASYLKGAPEVLLARCRMDDAERRGWLEKAHAEARGGHRVLAVAGAEGEREEDLRFLGLVSLWDPPRREAADAIRAAQDAGIRVLMVTGDHPETALAVARAVGIRGERAITGDDIERLDPPALAQAAREAAVFARVGPEQKVRIVEALQSAGEIVAMTGDGVNDAPALKRADVGVAMGKRGSDVAREAADLVLLDDDFATIVTAIEEGRSLYANIQKFILFMFSTSLALLLLVVGGAAGSWWLDLRTPAGALLLPLTAIQILWINLVVDGPPALAMGLDKNPDVMRRPPLPPSSGLLDRRGIAWVLLAGGAKAAVGLALLLVVPALGYGLLAAQTALFAFEYLAQLAYAYPARRLQGRSPPNHVLGAVTLGLAALQGVLIALPPTRAFFGATAFDAGLAGIVLAAALLTWIFAEATTRIMRPRAEGR